MLPRFAERFFLASQREPLDWKLYKLDLVIARMVECVIEDSRDRGVRSTLLDVADHGLFSKDICQHDGCLLIRGCCGLSCLVSTSYHFEFFFIEFAHDSSSPY